MKKQAGIGTVKQVAWASVLISTLLLPTVIYALSVDDAKRAGWVTETSRGYLQATRHTPEVKRLVDRTNDARNAKYREIARQLNVDLSTVERDFGRKLGGR